MLCILVGAAVLAPAAAAAPTWSNLYDWPGGHGYVGWSPLDAGPSAGLYGVARGLPGANGLWAWPNGGDYEPGSASWIYVAPQEGHILAATVHVTYRNRLVSHHCVRIALGNDVGDRNAAADCQPLDPIDGATTRTFTVADPAGLATRLTAGIVLPCQHSNPAACRKHIPQALPQQIGLRVDRVDLTLEDDGAPTVTASGPLRDMAGTYIDGSAAYELKISANDPSSGVRQLVLERNNSLDSFDDGSGCDPAHHTEDLGARICPVSVERTGLVDTKTLPEGTSRFAARATDVAGNAARSEEWTLIVDRTPPSAPTGFEASLDPDEDVTFLDWDSGADPVLRDGTPGSGLSVERYRYINADGDWSAWGDVTDANADAELHGFRLGDRITVEIYAVDRVGNQSSIVTATIPVELASSYNDDYELSEDVNITTAAYTNDLSAPGDPKAALLSGAGGDKATAASVRRRCPFSGIEPRLTDRADEKNVNIYAFGTVGCPIGDPAFQYMKVTTCVDVARDSGGWAPISACVTDKRNSPQPPAISVLNELCSPGTHKYRTRISIKIAFQFPKKDIHKTKTLSTDPLNCNEAGAWRVEATEGISSPSVVLGADLRRHSDFAPAAGFEAHHIVPASYASRAATAQKYAYSCGFTPNGFRNGVWLRGPNLRRAGEADATRNDTAYDDLPEGGKQRTYHRGVHTRRHFDWIAGLLDPDVDDNNNCDEESARVTLRTIKGLLEHDHATVGPDDNDPLSPDD